MKDTFPKGNHFEDSPDIGDRPMYRRVFGESHLFDEDEDDEKENATNNVMI